MVNHYKNAFWAMAAVTALCGYITLNQTLKNEYEEEEPLRTLESLNPESSGEDTNGPLTEIEKLLEERKNILEDFKTLNLEDNIKSQHGEEGIKVYRADKIFYDQNPELFDDAYFKPGIINVNAHLIIPRQFLTQLFFEHLERHILRENYEAALDLFLSSDERAYSRTLSAKDQTIESTLIYRLGLQNFMGVDLCGKQGQPSCDQVLMDPNCACPISHDEDAPLILKQIGYIAVAAGTNSAKGKLEIGFKVDMDYFTIDEGKVIIHTLLKGEPYKAQFTRHWEDIELMKK